MTGNGETAADRPRDLSGYSRPRVAQTVPVRRGVARSQRPRILALSTTRHASRNTENWIIIRACRATRNLLHLLRVVATRRAGSQPEELENIESSVVLRFCLCCVTHPRGNDRKILDRPSKDMSER